MAQLVKTVGGLAIASVKTVKGLAIASCKSINGLDSSTPSYTPNAISIPGNTNGSGNQSSEGYLYLNASFTGAANVTAGNTGSGIWIVRHKLRAMPTFADRNFVVMEAGQADMYIWAWRLSDTTYELEFYWDSMTNGNPVFTGKLGPISWASGGTWHTAALSWYCDNVGGESTKVKAVVDGTDGLWTPTGTQYNYKGMQGVPTSPEAWAVAADPVAADPKLGANLNLAGLWLSYGSGSSLYYDVTSGAVQSAFGLVTPIDWGSDGTAGSTLPAPLCCLRNAAATCEVNAGTGGDFTQSGSTAITDTTYP